jgi:hypothetical protein
VAVDVMVDWLRGGGWKLYEWMFDYGCECAPRGQ